jgi:uncharacterized phage protein gp47/JayE
MPFNRPSITTVNERITGDIDTNVPDGQPRLRRSLFGILGKVITGTVHALYGYLQYQAQQILPDTSDEENFARHASLKKVIRKLATAGTGNIVITGNNAAVMEPGKQWQRSDGIFYEVNEEVVISAGQAIVNLTATTPGANTNTAAGITFTLVETVDGIDSTAIVDGDGITGGADLESLESWRARYLDRIQKPPQGGNANDYVQWALEVPGVTRAWSYPLELGEGTITVRFVRDDEDVIPTEQDVETVQAYIDSKRPVTGKTYVVAPIAADNDFTIALVPNNSVVQAAVQAELADLYRREAKPGGTILISRIREAVSIAAGESDNEVVSPSENVTHTTGQMPVLGEITWQ